jgi:uncharacterized protein YdhG (YjbR/CyaY superfamily)
MSPVDEYLAGIDPPQRAELKRIREIVRRLVPEADEGISYRIPGFKYQGKYLLGYAAFKDHLSLFPTAWPIEALAERLEGYKLARGTIQFTLENKLSEELLSDLVKVRLKAIIDSPQDSDYS